MRRISLEQMSPVTLAHLRSIGWTLFECVDCSAQRLGPEGMDRCGDCQPANCRRNYTKVVRTRKFCKNGHEMTPDNCMRRKKHRGVECRECRRECTRRSRERVQRHTVAIEMREGA